MNMSGLKYSDLMKCRIGGYEPPYMHRPPFIQMGLPPFTLWTVEFMRRDYQVKIGMAIKLACLLKAKFKISGAPAEKEFCEALLRQLWLHVIPHAVSAHYYTQSACEMVYEEKKGMVQFKMCRPIYPTDWRIFTKGGNKHAIRVKTRQQSNQPENSPIWLYGPKSFLYVHRREFGSWNGISELEGAYPSWLDKRDQQGAIAIRRLWFYKNAFDSGFVLCPPGMYNAENGEKVPYRDLARQALESSMTGATWVFDNVVDEQGRPQWHFERPQMNQNGDAILQYIDALDTEILRGLEIPDDVISQVSGTGSYAGRTIPLSAFFISQNQQLFWLVRELKEQIIDPIMRLNFGKDPDYEIESAEVNTDALMPSGPGEGGETEDSNPQVPPAAEAENFARQQAQQSQQQLSRLIDTMQAMIDQKPVANAEINGEGASLMDLPKRKESTSVYQFSGGIHPYFASQVSAKTGVSPQLAASAILLGEAAHCGTAEQLANLLHLDTARKALATFATSSMDPTVVRGFDSSGMPDYTVVTSADDPSLLYRLSQGSPEGCVEQPELEVLR